MLAWSGHLVVQPRYLLVPALDLFVVLNSRLSLGSLVGRRSGERAVLCRHGLGLLVRFACNFVL